MRRIKGTRFAVRSVGPRNIGAIYVWLVIIVVFSVVSRGFLSVQTFEEILNQYAVTGLISLALVLPLAAGLFDLSIGATAGLSGMIVAWTLAHVTSSITVAIGVGLVSGIVAGLINSGAVLLLGVDSLIATLATSSIFTALAIAIEGPSPISQNVAGAFGNDLALTNVGGVTLPVFYLVGLLLLMSYVLEKTVFGRHIYAVGFDREVARLGGVRVRAILGQTLIAGAVVAALGGVVVTATLGAADSATGPSYLLPAFAAVFLGATQFRRGRFNAWGTVVAVLLLGTANVGLLSVGAPAWTPDVFEGIVLIAAVAAASAESARLVPRLRLRRRGGVANTSSTGHAEVGSVNDANSSDSAGE